MRLTTVLLIATFMQVSAAGFAQKINLSRSNASLKAVIKELRSQSGYDFVYTDDQLAKATPVSIKVNNMPIEDVLKQIFQDQPLSYTIDTKTVIINEKEKSILNKIANYFLPIDVSGRILDDKGNALVGATIKVKGTSKSTTTDRLGNFTLLGVDEDALIEISYVGFATQTLRVTRNMGNISLAVSTAGLDEVTIVNTGFQKINRTNMTGSAVTVSSAELEKRNITNVMQGLEGLVPGLVQSRLRTTIRGLSTISANTSILYVVDGLPIDGDINNINPYDIESVSVLKDAAAASMYGARASNGVIVVTTKRAKEIGKTSIEISSNITLTEKPDYSYNNWMTPTQQVDWENNYYKWWFAGGGNGGPLVANPITDFESRIASSTVISPIAYGSYQLKKGLIAQTQYDALLAELKTNNFQEEYKTLALQSPILQQYNIAIRTNSGKAQNSLVINYTPNYTGNINSFNKALNLFYKGTYSVGKWLDMDYGVNSIIGKSRSHNNDLATSATNLPAYFRLLNDNGSRASYNVRFNAYNAINNETTPALASFKFNHLDELERDFNNTSTLNTRYYVNLNFKPVQGLTINPMFQVEDSRTTSRAYSEAESYTMRILQNAYTTRTGTAGNYVYTNLLPKGGRLATSQNSGTNYTARGQANYNKEFGKHGVIALIGAEFRQTFSKGGSRGILLGFDDQLQTQSTNQINFGNLYNINTGSVWDTNYQTRQIHFGQISNDFIGLIRESLHRFGSGYANITYTYNRKYNLFASARKDYADLFGGDEKYRGKPLWSAGASWVTSNEDFMRDISFINYLKVRASYGFTGNIRTDVTALLAASTGTNTTTLLPNASVSNPPNPQLRWEKTATTNAGVDFNMLSNRLRGTLDWYRRSGTDLFATKRLDPSEGFTSMVINNAAMVNNGVEIGLSYDIFKPSPKGFFWSSNLNASINNNRVTEVDELTKNPNTLAQGGSFKVGYPVASIFAFRFAGLNNLGVPQFYNAAGQATTASLGPTDADALVYMGNAEPRYTLSINNDFNYRGFSLSVFAMYQGGHYFVAGQVPQSLSVATYSTMPSYLLNSWTPTNTNTTIPGSGQYFQNIPSNQYNYADILIRRADWFKVRNIVLGYSIPNQLASKIKASNVKLRLQVNDPDLIWSKQTDFRIDSETAGAPKRTAFVFGLNANF